MISKTRTLIAANLNGVTVLYLVSLIHDMRSVSRLFPGVAGIACTGRDACPVHV